MNLSEMYQEMGIDQDVYAYGQKITEDLKERFSEIDETAEYNQLKVLHAMLLPADMDTTILEEIHWNLYMQILSMQRQDWCVRRSLVELMHWQSHWQQTYAREMSF